MCGRSAARRCALDAAAVSVQCECERRQSSFHVSRARRLHVHDSSGTDYKPQQSFRCTIARCMERGKVCVRPVFRTRVPKRGRGNRGDDDEGECVSRRRGVSQLYLHSQVIVNTSVPLQVLCCSKTRKPRREDAEPSIRIAASLPISRKRSSTSAPISGRVRSRLLAV